MILARAPFRIPLGGGGTDLPSYYAQYGGFVLSAAINKYMYIYVNRPAADNYIRVKYSRYEQVSSPDEVQHDLVRPALKELGLNGSLEIVSMADIPAGTGLGSSSTYLVGLLTALYELKREKVPTHALAEMACHIEMDLAGHPVGKQDQYLAAFGGITCLDIAPNGRVQVTPLDISICTMEDLRHSVLLFYTGVTRSANDILLAQKQDTQRGETPPWWTACTGRRNWASGSRMPWNVATSSASAGCWTSIGRTKSVVRARSAIRASTSGTNARRRTARWAARSWARAAAGSSCSVA